MAKHKYKVTLPDGYVATRETDRTYTHLVAVRLEGETHWRWHGWCGRPDLAMKERRKAEATGRVAETRVLEVPARADAKGQAECGLCGKPIHDGRCHYCNVGQAGLANG